MNNILIPFPDKNNFKFFMENNIDGFIIGIEGYSETFNHLVKMSELNDICKMLKEKDKKIYIMLNKVYFNNIFRLLPLYLFPLLCVYFIYILLYFYRYVNYRNPART